MQDGAGDVVEGEVRLRFGQPQRHEPLPVVEELHLVGVRRSDAAPRLRPAAARQVLKRAANQRKKVPSMIRDETKCEISSLSCTS